jgi:hypothetical protein
MRSVHPPDALHKVRIVLWNYVNAQQIMKLFFRKPKIIFPAFDLFSWLPTLKGLRD